MINYNNLTLREFKRIRLGKLYGIDYNTHRVHSLSFSTNMYGEIVIYNEYDRFIGFLSTSRARTRLSNGVYRYKMLIRFRKYSSSSKYGNTIGLRNNKLPSLEELENFILNSADYLRYNRI